MGPRPPKAERPWALALAQEAEVITVADTAAAVAIAANGAISDIDRQHGL